MKEQTSIDNTFYTCKNDRAFKEVFMKEENKDLLIALLESILNIHIVELKYLNLEKNVDNINVRRKHFDLHVKTDTENIQIEVNSTVYDYLRPRNAAFLFDTYSHEVRKGNNYTEDTLIIQINFTYGLTKSKYYDKRDKPINKFMLTNENNKAYINNLIIYEFNMDYFNKVWYSNDEKEIDKYKYLIMMNLGLDDLKELSKRDKVVNKYMNELKRVNEDPDFREYISAEQDNMMIENSIRLQMQKEGFEKGLDTGIELNKNEIAHKMLKKGISEKDIIEITGITEKDFKKLTEK